MTVTSNRSRPVRCRSLTLVRSLVPAPPSRPPAEDRADPKGVRLDLGSSAKALLADRAAAHIADELGSGALVSIGGDVAVAGAPPPEGWAIGIAVDSSAGRRRRRPGRGHPSRRAGQFEHRGTDLADGCEQVHHIVDPATGRSAAPYWRLVSAAGASCVDANALSTAAVVWGARGPRAAAPVRPGGPAAAPRRRGLHARRLARGRAAVNSTYLWYATRASGIVTLILLTLTMVLGLATTSRARARNWPGFAQQEIHRRISIMAVVFLAIHVLTSILDTYVHIGWFAVVVPFTSPYSRFWVGLGTIALDLMVAVFVSSLLRAHLKPGTWRGIHWLAYASWPIALAHTFGIGTDSREHWVIALGALCVLSVGLALVWRLRATAKRRAMLADPARQSR